MRIADLNGDGKAELLGSLTEYRHMLHIQHPPTSNILSANRQPDLVALTIERSVVWM